jgi:hypothetical protein
VSVINASMKKDRQEPQVFLVLAGSLRDDDRKARGNVCFPIEVLGPEDY